MRYRAVLFDLDGVLCRTDRYHFQSWKTIADALHIPFDENVNDLLRGIGRMESLDLILRGYRGRPLTREERETLASEKNRLYRGLLEEMGPEDISPGAADLLNWLRERGVAMAVASSSQNARTIIGRLGIGAYFDAVVDGNRVARSKPDPEVFLLAAKELGLPPDGCLVVEDAESGVRAAAAGGFACAGIGAAAQVDGVAYPLKCLGDLKGALLL